MSSILFDEGSPAPPRPVSKKQLLPHIVDGMANSQPFALYAEYPFSPTSYEPGFRKVTYRDLANVVNGLAWQLHDTLGPGKCFPTLTYIGPNDLRYVALTLACVKVGYKLLLTSPRNSISAHQNLFKVTGCEILLHPTPQPPPVKAVLASCKLRALEIPSVEELLGSRHCHYPYAKKFSESRNEPFVVLHTSGTTGLPKPITWSHDFVSACHQWLTLEAPEGFISDLTLTVGVKMFLTLPPFHAAGVIAECLPMFYQTKIIYPLSGVFPSAQLVADALKHTTADLVVLAPPFVDEMHKSPEILEAIVTNADSVVWVGGPIPKRIGDEITKRTKLWTMIGMTEATVLPTIRPLDWPEDDWQFVRFNPASKIVLRHNSEDLYEAIIVRHPDFEQEQPCFKVFPNLTEWGTSDLYSPHPSNPELWLPRGRADDIIIFLNGEKTNPISMEQHVAKHPEVRVALVLGRLRLEAALLVELETGEHLSTIQRAEVIERIWPTIEEANQDCPRHAKVSKSRILFAEPEKPMLRAGKGTVQRQPTLNLYDKEIEALYEAAETASAPSESVSPHPKVDIHDSAAVLTFVRDIFKKITLSSLDDSEDFFASGMDSLQAIQATRHLKHGLSLPEFEISNIYTNPSILLVTEKILQLSDHHKDLTASTKDFQIKELETMLKEYSDLVDVIARSEVKTSTNRTTDNDRVVILTGSTGGIGCYVLQVLLEYPTVSHIYCLNRSSDSATLQSQRSGSRHLSTNFPGNKVTFLTSDLSKVDLGLGDETYNKVRSAATDIIHAAWPVNFNLTLPSFRPHLLGILNLLTLSSSSLLNPSLLFLSSISSITASPITPIPEQVLTDLCTPAPMGYARSKYLAERILDHAAHVLSNLDIKVARVGQVAGPALTAGAWNKWEWVPSLVISSQHLGAIPSSLGNSQSEVNWVPIDLLSEALVELTLADSKSEHGASFFHPLNPEPTTWEYLLPFVIEALGGEKAIREVPFENWLQIIKSDAKELGSRDLEELLRVNPSIKLLDFYEALLVDRLPAMEVKKATTASEKLRELRGIKGEWMQKWVKDWIEK